MKRITKEELLDKLDIAFELHEDPCFSDSKQIKRWQEIHLVIRDLIADFFEEEK